MEPEIQTDSSGQQYIEVQLSNDEQVRVTFIPHSWSGAGGVRVQIRQTNGHLRQGPEIPISAVGQVVSAVINLIHSQAPQ